MKSVCLMLAAAFTAIGNAAAAPIAAAPEPGKRTVHFVQDDAQDYMVSKIYVLRYVQSNDVMPFVMSMVKRYNMNSVVNCIEYGAQNEQILTVTTPIGMMPYVDDFIAKADRPVMIDGKVPGEILRGTGITRFPTRLTAGRSARSYPADSGRPPRRPDRRSGGFPHWPGGPLRTSFRTVPSGQRECSRP